MQNLPFDVQPVLNMIDKVLAQAQVDSFLANTYSKFLITYLFQSKKDIIKITSLTLKLNKIDISITGFMKKQWCVEAGYIEVISQKKNSVRLKLTNQGRLMSDTYIYTNPIVKMTYLKRFINSINDTIHFIILVFKGLVAIIFTKKTWEIIKGIGVILAIIVALITIYKLNSDSNSKEKVKQIKESH